MGILLLLGADVGVAVEAVVGARGGEFEVGIHEKKRKNYVADAAGEPDGDE